MAYCKKCGAYIPIGDTACPACGYDPEEEARQAKEAQEKAEERTTEDGTRQGHADATGSESPHSKGHDTEAADEPDEHALHAGDEGEAIARETLDPVEQGIAESEHDADKQHDEEDGDDISTTRRSAGNFLLDNINHISTLEADIHGFTIVFAIDGFLGSG